MASENRLTRSSSAPKTGIVHFGPGAFFRAFNAVYTDDAMQARGGDWGISTVSLKSATAHDQLMPQGGLFTSVTLGPKGPKPRIISSISDVLVAPRDPLAVVDTMDRFDVPIVSLTITEKGYCYDSVSKSIDLSHPEVTEDLNSENSLQTAAALIVASLDRRFKSDRAPFTVLSCDNLPSNGDVTRSVIEGFARARDPELADWIAENVAFPSTMVDRITPATTVDDLENLAKQTGYFDPAAVFHEPFRQWVIEDQFPRGRPAWDAAGAQLVKSVDAHELMKLRCLNGTHSALAYLGYLAGFETISETVTDPSFEALCAKLWIEEIVPTVPTPEGEDLRAYTASLIKRYQNPSIRHRTWQIAMDGSQKLPQRILATVRDCLAHGRTPKGLCLVVAAWMRYVRGFDERGNAIDVRDPLAERLRALANAASDEEGVVSRLVSVEEVFGADLSQNPIFVAEVTVAYKILSDQGAKAAVAKYVHEA